MEQDIRWLQRYDSFNRACARILDVTESGISADDLSELEKEGLIQRFEYTFELAWKTLQDLLKHWGYQDINGPNPVLQKAFEIGLLTGAERWRRMAKARNTTSHTYNEGDAGEIVEMIFSEYSVLLKNLDIRLHNESKKQSNTCLD